jgi:Ca2+-binding RTX toxin-like protein
MATYRGTRGSDIFYDATTGNDTYYGYDGGDLFWSSPGSDTYYGGDGEDRVSYTNSQVPVAADLLAGQSYQPGGQGGKDYFFDIENIDGSYFNDSLYGNNANNELRGSLGRDRLYGRGGSDTLYADPTDLMIDGGTGSDTLVMFLNDAPGTATLNDDGTGSFVSDLGLVPLAGIENIRIESAYDVVCLGNSGNNDLTTGSGDDTLDGGDGSDHLWGRAGADTFVFDHLGAGSQNQNDVIYDFEPGVDRIDLSNTPVVDFNDLFTGGDRYAEEVNDGDFTGVMIHTSVNAHTHILLMNVQMSGLTSADFLF